MDLYPKTLSEFENRFSSEKECRDYLFELRWSNGFICPHCGFNKSWPIDDVLFQCAQCNHQISVIAGTIFHGTHKPLTLWFRTIWWLTGQKNGASALGLKRILGLGSYKTAWLWLHKLRRAMVTPGRDRLSGIIEVDESYIGGEKSGKRGRGAAGKAIVVIAAEINDDRIGRIRLTRVENASASNLENAVKESVCPGSTIRTDDWNGYNRLETIGYILDTVKKQSVQQKNLLPSCHMVASLLKRWLLGTHQGAVSHEHLDYYLDEFTFRFNRRKSSHRGMLFYRLLQNAVKVESVTYKEMTKNVRGQKPRHHNI
ncbi:MAG: IS1595 family transposase [Calditrichaeota bacterium]|nr:IS1595 family transposase [Calditrichota bacterium]